MQDAISRIIRIETFYSKFCNFIYDISFKLNEFSTSKDIIEAYFLIILTKGYSVHPHTVMLNLHKSRFCSYFRNR